MTEPACRAEGSLQTRPVHMAVLEAVRVHARLLPSCSSKASCCGFESSGFKLYPGSVVGAAVLLPHPFSCLPASVLTRGAVLTSCTRPLLRRLKLRLLRRSEVPWVGCQDLAATAMVSNKALKLSSKPAGLLPASFTGTFLTAHCFAVSFLRLFVDFFFSIYTAKLLQTFIVYPVLLWWILTAEPCKISSAITARLLSP